ncbi:MAG: FtsQ-type POTRA domain-containing protein [Endomicrobium sp.]|jgi:cell division protein FtsQ|nr:FtsQ-type POTRA domain-containing protein [Endomicrobium sp.]
MTERKKSRYVYKAVRANSCYFRDKKVRKIFKFFFYLMSFGVIVCSLYFGINEILSIIYKSDKIIIKDIDIIGAKNITKAEIKEILPFKVGDNLLKVKLFETESEIKKLKPELKNIIINRRWQKIKIKLYERTPEAFVTQNGEIYGIDFDDMTFPLRGFMGEMKVPKIIYKNDEERKRLLDFIKRFKLSCDGFLNNILEMRINSTDDIVFVVTDNTTIIWGGEMSEHLPNKFKKFRKVYEDAISRYKQIEYINMNLYSFGRIVVKPVVGILTK